MTILVARRVNETEQIEISFSNPVNYKVVGAFIKSSDKSSVYPIADEKVALPADEVSWIVDLLCEPVTEQEHTNPTVSVEIKQGDENLLIAAGRSNPTKVGTAGKLPNRQRVMLFSKLILD